MNRHMRSTALLLSLLVVLSSVSTAGATHHQRFGELVRPGVTDRVSIASDGTQANGRSGAHCSEDGPSISDDGRFVAFTSMASNLDDRDINGKALPDVYLHDRKTGRTRLISVLATGAGVPVPVGTTQACIATEYGLLGSYEPAISGNGRFVAFTSAAQLVAGSNPDALPIANIYVHDRIKGTTELVSKAKRDSPTGAPLVADGPSSQPAISDDGRYVSFGSQAGNLVEEPTCSADIAGVVAGGCTWQVYIHDRKTDTLKLVSRTSEGAPSPGNVSGGTSSRHGLSDDGRFSVFETASNLTPNDQNVCVPLVCTSRDVYVNDTKTGKTELISVGRDGMSTVGISRIPSLQAQVISADGRFVVFESDSKGLVPANHPLYGNAIYVRDRKLNRTDRITASTGEYLGGHNPSISDDGRFVMQSAGGSPEFTGETSGEWAGNNAGIIRHDRRTGQTDIVRLDMYQSEHVGESAGIPVITGSARHFVWWSLDPHGFEDTNDDKDVFVRDLGAVQAFGTAFLRLGEDDFRIPNGQRSLSDGVLAVADARHDGPPGLDGSEILGARLAYRGRYDDLYMRIDLERIPVLSPLIIGDPTTIYGLEFFSGSNRYEVRVSGGLTPRFGLFRCSSDPCEEVTSLNGSYGTAGESVIATLPVDLIESRGRVEMSRLRAFSALGTYELGPRLGLDRVVLAS